jgi:hypothetical protein
LPLPLQHLEMRVRLLSQPFALEHGVLEPVQRDNLARLGPFERRFDWLSGRFCVSDTPFPSPKPDPYS